MIKWQAQSSKIMFEYLSRLKWGCHCENIRQIILWTLCLVRATTRHLSSATCHQPFSHKHLPTLLTNRRLMELVLGVKISDNPMMIQIKAALLAVSPSTFWYLDEPVWEQYTSVLLQTSIKSRMANMIKLPLENYILVPFNWFWCCI